MIEFIVTVTAIGIMIYYYKLTSIKTKFHKFEQKNMTYADINNRQESKKTTKEELKIQINKVLNQLNNDNADNSIIDVTDQSCEINFNDNLKKYSGAVPYWEHHYVYSHYEIDDSSDEQKRFYIIFKNSFLRGEYFDLEGNTNYAFILLFDLLNDYDSQNDIGILENQIKILGQFYPKTKPYGISFLIKKTKTIGEDFLRLRAEESYQNYNYNDNYDYWKLGTKYKTKLKLDRDEEELLNKFWYSSNAFCGIEYCFLEVLKLYLLVILELKNKYIQEVTTIDEQSLEIADLIARKHFRYKKGSQNYKFCIESKTNEIYIFTFKYCENSVREYYGHKRKISTDIFYNEAEIKVAFQTKIIPKITELLPILISKVSLPDEPTEIELNTQNVNRWRIKFEELTRNYNDKPKEFFDAIILLGKLNKKNPSIKNIFFEAFKFIVPHDRQMALELYVYYAYHGLKSANFENKKLTKNIQKNLFETNEQLQDFEKIVVDLIKDKDLDKALKEVNKIYENKRKKIQLDISSIKQVEKQHSGTVELLNKYLKDDFEEGIIVAEMPAEMSEEKPIKIQELISAEAINSAFSSELTFTKIHIEILELFAKNNFSILQSEVEFFTKSKGIFKNQLIESLNDACYELLDDLLIEEEGDYYTINTNYFQKIFAK